MTNQRRVVLALIASGAAVGVLMGLSVSPTASTVVGGIMAVLLAVVSALAGVESQPSKAEKAGDKAEGAAPEPGAPETPPPVPLAARQPKVKVTPIPVACVVAGVVLGAIGGISIRTHRLLMEDPARVVERWTALGLDKKDVAQRLFETSYGLDQAEAEKKDEKKEDKKEAKKEDKKEEVKTLGQALAAADRGILFADVLKSDCDDLRSSKQAADLRRVMRGSINRHVRAFEQRVSDDVARRIQPVIATHSLNRSAGVWKPSVLRGLSFNCLAIELSFAWE